MQVKTAAWEQEGRDYHYSELLERVFDIMRAKNPAMVQGEKRRFVMKPPQVSQQRILLHRLREDR